MGQRGDVLATMGYGQALGICPVGVMEGLLLLREEGAMGLVPFEDDVEAGGDGDGRRVYAVDRREKERLPRTGLCSCDDGEGGGSRYLFQRLRHLVANTVPELAELKPDPSTRDLATTRHVEYLDARLEYKRKANLRMRWRAMERLESLCLDLRGYIYPGAQDIHLDEVLVRLGD